MAARKLQAEIDRTLKTVAQGVELFEQLYDKLQASTNQTQKEKLESDLKTQIKKLQRLRDQIKGWLGNNDIKDKKPLLDNRKLIETQMERFKATEKEMKTKAFSKEGLIAAAKLDPLEKAKMEMSNWLSNQVDELSRQIEMSEAEIEQASSGAGKKSKKGGATGGSNERVSELETLNERRNWHVGRLEILLRMLENGTLEIEDVETIKDDIAYYVESNAEEDFEEDEGIYDEFNLDEEEEAFGLQQNDDILSSHDGASVAEEPPKTPVKESATAKTRRDSEDATKKEEMDKSAISSAKKTARKVTDPTSTSTSSASATKPTAEKEKTVPPANFSQAQVKPSVPVQAPTPSSTSTAPSTTAATAPILSPPKPPASNQLPPIRYAAAAAAAVSPSSINAPPPGISPTVQSAPAGPTSNDPSAAAKEEDASNQQQSTKQQISPVPSSNNASVASAPGSEIKSKEDSTSATTAAPSNVGPPPGIGAAGPPGLIPRSQSPSVATSSPSLTYSSARGGVGGGGVQSNSQGSPAISHSSSANPVGMNVAPGSNIEENKENQQQQQQQPLPPVDDSASSNFQPAQLAASSAAAGVVQPLGGGAGTTSQQLQAQKLSGTESRLPSSLSDLVTSFESVKQKSMLLNNQNNSKGGAGGVGGSNPNQIYNNLNTLHESLENSFINLPEPIDSEKPKYYIPKNPFNTPGYYPQNPSGIFENPNIYSKFDVDTLFYIFYYQQGTYHQYLAAKELKKQSWRFHKQYLTWFQRHSEPQAITDEYEQGVYVYFDWENSWCQRKKSDFRFEYRWLEEN